MTRPRKKIPAQAGFEPGTFRSRGGRLTTRPTRRWYHRERRSVGARLFDMRRLRHWTVGSRAVTVDCRMSSSDCLSGTMCVDMRPAVSRLARLSTKGDRPIFSFLGVGVCHHSVLSKVRKAVSLFFICN